MPFDWAQYEEMAQILGSIQGKAILSINDHPDVRSCFSAFQFEEVPISYTVAGGGKAVDRKELIFYSWDREAEPAGLF